MKKFWLMFAFVLCGALAFTSCDKDDEITPGGDNTETPSGEWKVGIEHSYSVSIGKFGKYLEKYLSEENWQELLSTYADGNYKDMWRALFAMLVLFRTTAMFVAEGLGYEYSREEDAKVTAYLEHISHLSPNATKIYG